MAYDKAKLLRELLAQLEREFTTLNHAAQVAREGATNAEVKAENKYDTRGLEASYLAHGQSKRAAEIRDAIAKLRVFPLREFGIAEAAQAGAVVGLQGSLGLAHYFILPFVGGYGVHDGGREVKILSTLSPLAKEIIGRSPGETFTFHGKEQTLVDVF